MCMQVPRERMPLTDSTNGNEVDGNINEVDGNEIDGYVNVNEVDGNRGDCRNSRG